MKQPAIGLVELESIARGLWVSDAMMKKAPVDLLLSQTVSPGKYLVMVSGDVASVQESTKIGIQLSEDSILDSLFIPNIHEQVIPGIQKKFTKAKLEAVGIVESKSVASTILSLDQALKAAHVTLLDIRLGQGLGGKGYFVLTGDLSEVEASVAAASRVLEDGQKQLKTEIIARPHEDFKLRLEL